VVDFRVRWSVNLRRLLPVMVMVMAMLLSLSPLAAAEGGAAVATQRPTDMLDLRESAPDILQDMRYFGSNNFIGRPIAGYEAAKCLLTRRAVEALVAVQQQLRPFAYSLKVYDCYRPQSAVDDFVRWAADLDDQRMKPRFYPRVDKQQLIPDGYIAVKSGHSRGSSVDLTIVPLPAVEQPAYDPGAALRSCEAFQTKRYLDNGLDMGTGYDCFSPLSHSDNLDIGPRSHSNRQLLKTLMEQQGFVNLAAEWWHFSLKEEPYPQTRFNFPIR